MCGARGDGIVARLVPCEREIGGLVSGRVTGMGAELRHLFLFATGQVLAAARWRCSFAALFVMESLFYRCLIFALSFLVQPDVLAHCACCAVERRAQCDQLWGLLPADLRLARVQW